MLPNKVPVQPGTGHLEKKQSGLLRYPVYVQPVEPGDQIELENVKRPSRVNVFATDHAREKLCLGFEIEEERRGVDPINGLVSQVVKPVFFYSGDGFQTHHVSCGRIDLAVHEATFLERDVGEAASRIEHRHCTVESAVEWGASQDVKALVLAHMSDRYEPEEIVNAASEAAQNCAFRGSLWVAHRDQLLEVT
jgi:ribonuclease BN (tRNA processing enzyme)